MTLDEVKQAVIDTDPLLEADDPAFAVAVILLSATFIGPIKYKLQHFTGYSQRFVNRVWHNFRRNGIFVGAARGSATRNLRTVAHSGWDDEETGAIAFWLDVLCGQGLIERMLED